MNLIFIASRVYIIMISLSGVSSLRFCSTAKASPDLIKELLLNPNLPREGGYQHTEVELTKNLLNHVWASVVKNNQTGLDHWAFDKVTQAERVGVQDRLRQRLHETPEEGEKRRRHQAIYGPNVTKSQAHLISGSSSLFLDHLKKVIACLFRW